jgi:hypothetical protein
MIALGAGFRIAARVLASCGFAFALIGSVYDLPMMWALPGFWVWLACLVSIFAASFLAHPNGAQGNA